MSETGSDDKKTCFVIAPIGAEKSNSRDRSDKVLKYIIKPVFEPAYKVERADQLDEPGIITNQIVKKIVDCDVLVADLSEANPNVFYELAIRHGLKKPFVHLIDSAETIPFDNSQVRTIQFDISDLDSVDNAKSQLARQLRTIEAGDTPNESPISVAFDLEALKSNIGDDNGIMSAMLDQLTILGRDVRTLKAEQKFAGKDMVKISDVSDLLQTIFQSGNKPLLDLAERHVKELYGSTPSISILTDLGTDQEERLATDIARTISSYTGVKHQVDIMPF